MATIPTANISTVNVQRSEASDLQKQELFLLLNKIVKENKGKRSQMFGKILQALQNIADGSVSTSNNDTRNNNTRNNVVTSNGSIKEQIR